MGTPVVGEYLIVGREVFNARAGMLAAAIVAVWPSFLLHSTQMIRDSFAILCLLALLLTLTLLVRRQMSLAAGLATGAAGAGCRSASRWRRAR